MWQASGQHLWIHAVESWFFCSHITTRFHPRQVRRLLMKVKGRAQLRHEVVFSQWWTQVDTRSMHNTLCGGTCSSGQLYDMPGERRWTKTGQRWVVWDSRRCCMQTRRPQRCLDTDTGRRWHHYLECLHLLAWGRHHRSLCLQLHSRHCALCLRARQDNTIHSQTS